MADVIMEACGNTLQIPSVFSVRKQRMKTVEEVLEEGAPYDFSALTS